MEILTRTLLVSMLFYPPISGGQCDEKVTLATFNTGLSSQLIGYSERRTRIPNVLRDLNVDVICLQEVWFEDDLHNILVSTTASGFNSFSTIHNRINNLRDVPSSVWNRAVSVLRNAPCLTWHLVPFLSCQMWNCRGMSLMGLLRCMEEKCTSYLDAIPQECVTCLVIGLSSLKTGFQRCGSFYREYNRFNTQGLLLLSKKKIISANYYTFINKTTKQILPRGYIEAEIEDVGTVICTHLTANVSSVRFEYNLNYSRPENQNAEEIRTLHETYQHRRHVIMGDLNTGPLDVNRDLWGDFPQNYQKIVGYGYVSPYENNNGNCTFCCYNNIQNDSTGNKLLDHILLTDQSYQDSARILTEKSEGSNLSDHFGIKVDVCI